MMDALVPMARTSSDSPGPLELEANTGGDRLVLVVDDEADLVQIVSDRLAAAGYRVLTAHDGIEALASVREAQPGCIILDLKMPRLSGFEALPAIRQAAPAARVIVLTGSPNRPLRDECRARGADDFMLKPSATSEVLADSAETSSRGESVAPGLQSVASSSLATACRFAPGTRWP
jgi:two-component system KDP operon response regulator KdpE